MARMRSITASPGHLFNASAPIRLIGQHAILVIGARKAERLLQPGDDGARGSILAKRHRIRFYNTSGGHVSVAKNCAAVKLLETARAPPVGLGAFSLGGLAMMLTRTRSARWCKAAALAAG